MKTYRDLIARLSYDLFIVSWGLYLLIAVVEAAKKGFFASIFNTNIILLIALVSGGVAMFASARSEVKVASKMTRIIYGLGVAVIACVAGYLAYRYAGTDAQGALLLGAAAFCVVGFVGWAMSEGGN